MNRLFIAGLCLAVLGGCGETDQAMTSENTNRADVAPWHGAKNPYSEAGWKPGDQASWETQLRTRGQYQNEYAKVN